MEPSMCGIDISAQVETNNEPLKLEPNFCSFIVFTVENFTPQTVFQLYTKLTPQPNVMLVQAYFDCFNSP